MAQEYSPLDPGRKRGLSPIFAGLSVALVAIAGAAGVWTLWSARVGPQEATSVDAAETADAQRPGPPRPFAGDPRAPIRLEQGAEVLIRNSDIDGPLELELELLPHTEVLHAALMRFDGKRTEFEPPIVDARLALDPELLSEPGRYVVEIKTTERSHMPTRRYAIEVIP